jgi:hypothetical protein
MRDIYPHRRPERMPNPRNHRAIRRYGYHRYLLDLVCGAIGLYILIKIAPEILGVVMDMLREILVNAFTGG